MISVTWTLHRLHSPVTHALYDVLPSSIIYYTTILPMLSHIKPIPVIQTQHYYITQSVIKIVTEMSYIATLPTLAVFRLPLTNVPPYADNDVRVRVTKSIDGVYRYDISVIDILTCCLHSIDNKQAYKIFYNMTKCM